MTRIIQKELDKAEEYVLNKLFGDINNPVISKKLQFILVAKKVDFDKFINEKIEIFEELIKDFINDDGYLDGEQISKMLAIQFPELKGLLLPDIKPLELAKLIDNIVGLEAIGQFIQNF